MSWVFESVVSLSARLSRRVTAVPVLLTALVAVAAGVPSAHGRVMIGARQIQAPDAPSDPVAGFTLRQLVGQKMVYGFDGPRVPSALVARIRRGEAGGVILFSRNAASRPVLRAEMRRLQAIRRPAGLGAPLLVMIDQEGGLVKRLDGAPTRSPAAIGRTGSVVIARSEGRATALNLRDAGVNVNLAPVLDVGRPGTFQQRTERSYSSRADRVAALGSAFVRGLQERGVAATLKHFPGLGLITRDEDSVVQTVALPLASLRRIDEAPFAAAIAAGADMVMTSTARYPALSPRPALLSRAVTTVELRRRLGFTGVAITDDLDVSALRSMGPARLAVDATRAGNDLLLYAQSASDADAAFHAVVAAARRGTVSVAELRVSARRVLALRTRLGAKR